MPYVTINYRGWDTHRQHFQIMRRKLPELDKGMATLLADLSARGLLSSTIVWWSGEFGRTPRVLWEPPWNGGRGHYGPVFSAVVAGGGVEAKVVEYVKPLSQKQYKDLREKLQELLKKPKDDAVSKEIAEIRKKLATFVRKPNPVLAEIVTLEVTVAPDAEPGPRELRVGAASGLSNPMAFHVGQLPEFTEKEAKPAAESRKGKAPRRSAASRVPSAPPEVQIAMPATGRQRRPRRQRLRAEHAPCRLLALCQRACRRGLLSPPRRRPEQGRAGICLPPAGQPAAAAASRR